MCNEDEVLLNQLEEENFLVEPEFYYPIVPIHMINGCVGIGTGNSIDLPSYNPRIITEWIRCWIRNKKGEEYEYPELEPFFNGFKGRVSKKTVNKKKRWITTGEFEQVDFKDDVIVRDLPATMTIDNYKKKLNKMMEKGEIKQWKDISYPTKDKSDIIPQIYISGIKNPTIKKLKLQKVISDTNINLLDEYGRVQNFTIVSLIEDFCCTRHKKYIERKEKITKLMKKEIKYLELKISYITKVKDDKFIIKNKTNEILHEEMKQNGYPLEFLKMPLSSITEAGINRLLKKIQDNKENLEKYENMDALDIWMLELDEFETKIKLQE